MATMVLFRVATNTPFSTLRDDADQAQNCCWPCLDASLHTGLGLSYKKNTTQHQRQKLRHVGRMGKRTSKFFLSRMNKLLLLQMLSVQAARRWRGFCEG
eukprot:3173589-Amphidinium_carterae.1